MRGYLIQTKKRYKWSRCFSVNETHICRNRDKTLLVQTQSTYIIFEYMVFTLRIDIAQHAAQQWCNVYSMEEMNSRGNRIVAMYAFDIEPARWSPRKNSWTPQLRKSSIWGLSSTLIFLIASASAITAHSPELLSAYGTRHTPRSALCQTSCMRRVPTFRNYNLSLFSFRLPHWLLADRADSLRASNAFTCYGWQSFLFTWGSWRTSWASSCVCQLPQIINATSCSWLWWKFKNDWRWIRCFGSLASSSAYCSIHIQWMRNT